MDDTTIWLHLDDGTIRTIRYLAARDGVTMEEKIQQLVYLWADEAE